MTLTKIIITPEGSQKVPLSEEDIAQMQIDLSEEPARKWQAIKSKCVQILTETEPKVGNDWSYPEDVPAWKAYRAQIRAIYRANTQADPDLVIWPEVPFA